MSGGHAPGAPPPSWTASSASPCSRLTPAETASEAPPARLPSASITCLLAFPAWLWVLRGSQAPRRAVCGTRGSLRTMHGFMHWRRKWQPTPVLLPGESQPWWAAVYGVAQKCLKEKPVSLKLDSDLIYSLLKTGLLSVPL